MGEEIKRTETIQAVFDRFPDKAQDLATIMTRHGLHCVGCHASVFETLEQGILGHGFPESVLVQLIEELNAAASGKELPFEIDLSDKAAEMISGLLTKEGKDSWGLRFGLKPGGNFEYDLAFREKPEPNESVHQVKRIRVFVAKHDKSKLHNASIDYVEGEEGTGFKISNPNET